MAVTYFHGAVDGDVTDNNNFTGNAPGVGDVCVFDRGAVDVDPSQGNVAAFGTLLIRPGYTGAIGASGNKMTSSIDKVIHTGIAPLWLDDSAGTTTDVYIRCASSNVIVHLGGVTMTNIELLRGDVTLDGSLGATAFLRVGYVSNLLTDVKCTIVTNANAITTLCQWGGRVTLNKTITSTHMAGGFLGIPVNTTGIQTNVYQEGGRMQNFGVGTIALLEVGPGTYDLGVQGKTITKSVLNPQGVILNRNEDVHTFTAPLVDLSEVT